MGRARSKTPSRQQHNGRNAVERGDVSSTPAAPPPPGRAAHRILHKPLLPSRDGSAYVETAAAAESSSRQSHQRRAKVLGLSLFASFALCIAAAAWRASHDTAMLAQQPLADAVPAAPPYLPPELRVRPGDVLETTMAVPGELLIRMVDLTISTHYELRLSFPGAPLVRFSLEMLLGEEGSTSRVLLDSEKLLFWSTSASELTVSDIEVPVASRDGRPTMVSRRARITGEWGAASITDAVAQQWTHAHVVVSLRPTYFGGLPSDSVPVIIACAVAVPLSLLVVCALLRNDVH